LMAAIVQDWGDFSIILALLAFNASLGFFEEHQASNALAALKNALALKAKVLRGGAWSEIAAQNIVPGDIIKIRLGDIVPADARLISGAFLSVDQAALTGESLPVSKKEGDLVYSGSIAKQGEMEAVVIATGGATFFGRTAKLVQKAGAASHFQAAVMRIGDFLIAIAAVLAVVLVAVQLSRGVDLLRLAEFVLIFLVASMPVAMPGVRGGRQIRRRRFSLPRSPPRRKPRIPSILLCSRACAIAPCSPPSSPRPISHSTR